MRKTWEMLEVILNFPFANPGQSESSDCWPYMEETQLGLVLLTTLNHCVWVALLETLEHCSVTFAPSWASTVWDSEPETKIQPETNGRESKQHLVLGLWNKGNTSSQHGYLLLLQRRKAMRVSLFIVRTTLIKPEHLCHPYRRLSIERGGALKSYGEGLLFLSPLFSSYDPPSCIWSFCSCLLMSKLIILCSSALPEFGGDSLSSSGPSMLPWRAPVLVGIIMDRKCKKWPKSVMHSFIIVHFLVSKCVHIFHSLS